MLTAKLSYTKDWKYFDGKKLYKMLADNNIRVLKETRSEISTPLVHIRIESKEKLNEIIKKLNDDCAFPITVEKTTADDELFGKICIGVICFSLGIAVSIIGGLFIAF